MARLHKGKGVFFLKYFFIFSAIVLASFFVVGSALMVFVTNFLRSENMDTATFYAEQLSENMGELLSSQTTQRNPEGAALLILNSVDLMSSCTDDDVFVCDKVGNVIVCPEMLEYDFSVSDTPCEKHSDLQLSPAYVQTAKKGGVAELSTMDSFYDNIHSVSMKPIYIGDEFIGFTVVAAPIATNLVENLQRIFQMFLIAAAIALLIVFIAVFFLTEHIARPIRNLETATRCYSTGDFSFRVPETNSHDELSELVKQFNYMAKSLAIIEESRRSFVANVSHEFKTPMTTIGGFINGILDGTIPPEKQDYYLGIVSSEIARLSKMVNMMLNISKIETGNVNLKLETFDVSQNLVTTFLGFEQLISKKNIEILGFEELESTTIRGDKDMINQAIYNLVDNAVKFTNDGGTIEVAASNTTGYGIFSIKNTGKGIPKKDIDKVFQRFYKVDQSRSTDVKSTGLGLYLIKTIVELHNGTITVDSVENEYTVFTVKLPK